MSENIISKINIKGDEYEIFVPKDWNEDKIDAVSYIEGRTHYATPDRDLKLELTYGDEAQEGLPSFGSVPATGELNIDGLTFNCGTSISISGTYTILDRADAIVSEQQVSQLYTIPELTNVGDLDEITIRGFGTFQEAVGWNKRLAIKLNTVKVEDGEDGIKVYYTFLDNDIGALKEAKIVIKPVNVHKLSPGYIPVDNESLIYKANGVIASSTKNPNSKYLSFMAILDGDGEPTGTCSVSVPENNKSKLTGHVEIPAYDPSGNLVTKIQDGGFSGCTNITSVWLPDSIKYLGDNIEQDGSGVFKECTNLAEVRMPKNLLRIGFSAFEKTQIKSIFIPKTVTNIFNNAFKTCTSLQDVTFEERRNYLHSLKIRMNAFTECTGLPAIKFPRGKLRFAGKTFHDCSNLKTVYIPKMHPKEEDDDTDTETFYNTSYPDFNTNGLIFYWEDTEAEVNSRLSELVRNLSWYTGSRRYFNYAVGDTNINAKIDTTFTDAQSILIGDGTNSFVNFPTNKTLYALYNGIINLKEQIGNLNHIMNFRGVYTSKSVAEVELNNAQAAGDVIVISGDQNDTDLGKEFVWDGDSWVELGFGSEALAAIANLKDKINGMDTYDNETLIIGSIS